MAAGQGRNPMGGALSTVPSPVLNPCHNLRVLAMVYRWARQSVGCDLDNRLVARPVSTIFPKAVRHP
jgi:hypothetical protein